jgi:phosphatidylglycerophosphate synthase
MKSTEPAEPEEFEEPLPPDAPGRPPEIEEPTNRLLVHPLSRALASALEATPVTPNQVSLASVIFAAAAGACYLTLATPWAALAGLVCQFVWHVLDGADGDLARRTGRASPIGELVDGVCDHLSQTIVYLALGVVLARQIGPWAWALASAAALSHFVQANAYETGRKTYRHWVYGAGWLRNTVGSVAQRGFIQGELSRFYLSLSDMTNPGEKGAESAMSAALAYSPASASAARGLYGKLFAPLVRSSFWLSGNTRTVAVFVSMMAGSPVWFFLFETTVLNLALGRVMVLRQRRNMLLMHSLGATTETGPPPAKTKPARR